MSGLTGQFYKQFAMTIAISTVISAFNSLTLSPALAAMLLKGHDERRTGSRAAWTVCSAVSSVSSTRSQARFGEVRQGRDRRGQPQGADDGRLCRAAGRRGLMGKVVPGGFVPAQDKEYLISFCAVAQRCVA